MGDFSYNMSFVPKEIQIREAVMSISSGKSHSIALTVCGRMYVWGNNCFGQLGIDKPEFRMRPNSNRPELIPGLEDVFFTKALCGPNHTLLLSSEGYVYSFGDNTCGQIGNGNVGQQFSPHRIDSTLFKDIVTYKENDISMAVSMDNKFYVWGLAKNRRFCEPKLITDASGQSIFDVYAIYAKKNVTFKTIIINDELKSWERVSENNFTSTQSNDDDDSIYEEIDDPEPVPQKQSTLPSAPPSYVPLERKAVTAGRRTIDHILDIKLFLKNPSMIDESLRKSIRLLYVWGIYGSKVIFATNEDNVYSFGHNRDGSLGLGTTEENILAPRLNTGLSGKRIVMIRNGYEHCIGLTASGQCYGWGHNNFGQLGIGHTQHTNKPELIEELADVRVVQVACGAHHSLALTINGEVFSWGHNTFAQLGDRTYNSRQTPTQVLINEKVVSISCGCYHSIALSESGRVYIWGNNTNGQLGRNPERDVRKTRLKPMSNRPKPIESLENIVFQKAVCGPNHSMLLTTDGYVYTFGLNTDGQIGNGTVEPQVTPFRVNKGLKIKDVIAYWENDMSIAIGADNKVYVWGLALDKKVVKPKEVHNSQGKSIFDIYAKLAKNRVTFKTVLVNEDEYQNPLKVNICQSVQTIQTVQTVAPIQTIPEPTSSRTSNSSPFGITEDVFPILSATSSSLPPIGHTNGMSEHLFRMSRLNDFVKRSEVPSPIASDDENDDIFSETENSLIDSQNLLANDFANHLKLSSDTSSRLRHTSSPFSQTNASAPNANPGVIGSEINPLRIAGSAVLNRFRSSFNNPDNYDLKITTEDKTIYCHKTILQIRNEMFWEKCLDLLKQTKTTVNEIHINPDSYNIFFAFIKYIYGLEPEIDSEVVGELQQMAMMFNEPVLNDLCAQHIDNTPTLTNVCALYEKAIIKGLKDLEKACVEFASNNWKSIVKSDAFQAMNDKLSKKLMLSIAGQTQLIVISSINSSLFLD